MKWYNEGKVSTNLSLQFWYSILALADCRFYVIFNLVLEQNDWSELRVWELTPTRVSYFNNLLKPHLTILNWHKCWPTKLHSISSKTSRKRFHIFKKRIQNQKRSAWTIFPSHSLEVWANKRIILLPCRKGKDHIEMSKLLLQFLNSTTSPSIQSKKVHLNMLEWENVIDYLLNTTAVLWQSQFVIKTNEIDMPPQLKIKSCRKKP